MPRSSDKGNVGFWLTEKCHAELKWNGRTLHRWMVALQAEPQHGALSIDVTDEGLKTIAGREATLGAISALPLVWIDILKNTYTCKTI